MCLNCNEICLAVQSQRFQWDSRATFVVSTVDLAWVGAWWLLLLKTPREGRVGLLSLLNTVWITFIASSCGLGQEAFLFCCMLRYLWDGAPSPLQPYHNWFGVILFYGYRWMCGCFPLGKFEALMCICVYMRIKIKLHVHKLPVIQSNPFYPFD